MSELAVSSLRRAPALTAARLVRRFLPLGCAVVGIGGYYVTHLLLNDAFNRYKGTAQ